MSETNPICFLEGNVEVSLLRGEFIIEVDNSVWGTVDEETLKNLLKAMRDALKTHYELRRNAGSEG